MRTLLAPLSVLALALVLVAVWEDRDREWKVYQAEYLERAASMEPDPDLARRILETPLAIQQIQTEVAGRVDRCTTCHMGIDNPKFADAEQPFRTHSKLQLLERMHPRLLEALGCSFCHDGQGLATTVKAAHGEVPHWDRPLLTEEWLETGCGRCHKGSLPLEGAPVLSQGRRLAKKFGCYRCHRMEGFDREETAAFGPDLRRVGWKLEEGWLKAWLKDPFASGVRTRMMKFYLSDEEAGALTRFLMQMRDEGSSPAGARPDDPEAARGRELFGKLRCFFCHETEGFRKEDMAPDLTEFGNKHAVDLDFGNVRDAGETLRSWTLRKIRDPRAFETEEARLSMPASHLADDEIPPLAVLLMSFTGDEAPKAYRRMEVPEEDEGKRLFDELHCVGCHNVRSRGIVGPHAEGVARDLSDIGDKIQVGWLVQWLRDPSSIDPDTKMPAVGFLTENEALKLAAYVIGFRREKEQEQEKVGGSAEVEEAAAASEAVLLDGRRLFESAECYRCHRVAGKGGRIAPDLTRVGEKVRKRWLLEWLRDPKNTNLRAPAGREMGLSDHDIEALAGYLLSLRGEPIAHPPEIPAGALLILDEKENVQDPVERGRRLFGEAGPVQFLFGKRVGRMGLGCYGCHRLGDRGGDIGPDLSEEGDKVKRDWLLRWLKDPRSYAADPRMGDFHLSDEDAAALTDFLMSQSARNPRAPIEARRASPP